MASSETPTSVATAIAARALSTLWRPGRLRVTDRRLVVPLTRTTSKHIRPSSARTFSARTLADSEKP